MLKNWKLAIVLAAVAMLSACGGGGSGSDPTPRGAVAINLVTKQGAIGVNYTSQPEANSRALDDCPGACIVALEFSGHGKCGSAAVASNGAWGVGSAGSKELADKRAVSSCLANGGNNCLIPQGLGQQCH